MCSDDINRYNARVGGPPVGAEDEEGFDVGDQALGNLRSGGRFTACQPGKSVAAHRGTFRHGGSAGLATDALTAGNSSWVRAMEPRLSRPRPTSTRPFA